MQHGMTKMPKMPANMLDTYAKPPRARKARAKRVALKSRKRKGGMPGMGM